MTKVYSGYIWSIIVHFYLRKLLDLCSATQKIRNNGHVCNQYLIIMIKKAKMDKNDQYLKTRQTIVKITDEIILSAQKT